MDGRRSHLELTAQGVKILETTRRFRMKFFAQLMSDWSDRECAEFGKLLIRFTDVLPDYLGAKIPPTKPEDAAMRGHSKN